MADSRVIELKLGEDVVPVQVRRVSTVRSRHTGRSLAEVQGVVSISRAEANERLTQTLREVGSRAVRAAAGTVQGVREWSVFWNAYSSSGTEHAHTLILREVEELSLEALVVDSVELHPYEYREEFTGDELTISAKFVGSRAGVLRLRALLKTRETFQVVRQGISDEPREMRFGVAEWSEHGGQIRVRLVLVDTDAEAEEHPELLRVEEANTRASLAYHMNLTERLSELLIEKGISTPEEMETLRDAARDAPWPARREFWRVRDVDQL